MNLTELFDEAVSRQASDIHLATGEKPRLRIAGSLLSMEAPSLDRLAMTRLLEPVFNSESFLRVESGLSVERQIVHADLMFAGIMFRSGDEGIAVTFRLVPKTIPDLEKIGYGAISLLNRIADAPRGFVLIAGPTGSGKWTTACAIIEAINVRKPARLFVIEAHPNYRFESKKGLVTQLHVGPDCESYSRALDIVHQADPDVIAVDNIPTAEVLRQMLVLASTGHLVVVNLHAESVVDAVGRLCLSAFDGPGTFMDGASREEGAATVGIGREGEALRRALSQNLLAITAQLLLPRADSPGRAAAYEWIFATSPVREAIQSGNFSRLHELQSSDPECRSRNQALDELVELGQVSEEVARTYRE